jgi:hypothetical protein
LGVSCILIVMKYGRVTKEERLNLYAIQQIFGKLAGIICVYIIHSL